MIQLKATCDICGVEKQESNHWVVIAPLRLTQSKEAVVFAPWTNEGAKQDMVLHVCGEGCAAKFLSGAITRWREEVAQCR